MKEKGNVSNREIKIARLVQPKLEPDNNLVLRNNLETERTENDE